MEANPVKPKLKDWIMLAASPAGIYFGARYTIDAVVAISEQLMIAPEIIALSAIALGTSLPELIVTITAAKKGKPEITIGNILGSNIFNSLMVMGIPALIGKLAIPAGIITFSLPLSLVAVLLFIIIIFDRKVNRLEGALLLLFYLFFIMRLFGLA
jgi:cation:H+ antiporter